MRDGLRAAAAYEERRAARRPAIPRKLFSAVITSLGVAFAAFRNDGQVMAAALYGTCAGVLMIAAFGIDPLRDKGMEGIDTHQQDRVARAIDGAEAHLSAIQDAIKRVRIRSLETRVERFCVTARDLEQNFAARTQKLLIDNRTDLTIEIDVLRDRLAREKQINN